MRIGVMYYHFYWAAEITSNRICGSSQVAIISCKMGIQDASVPFTLSLSLSLCLTHTHTYTPTTFKKLSLIVKVQAHMLTCVVV